MSSILEYDENDSGEKADEMTDSRSKFRKFIQKREDSDTSGVDQTYYRDQETIKEKDVLTNSFLPTRYVREGNTVSVATVVRRWPTLNLDIGAPGDSPKRKKQLLTERFSKGETEEQHFDSLLALATDLPPEVKNDEASEKLFLTSSTQTSPQTSHGGVYRLPGRARSADIPKTHDTHSSIGTQYESHSTASTPSGDFRWDLFPSVTDFQPTSFRRSVSLPEFDNPLLVSPRKCSVETTLSEGEDSHQNSSLNVWDMSMVAANSKCPQEVIQGIGSVKEPFAKSDRGASPSSGLNFQDEDGNIEQCETQNSNHRHRQDENIKQAAMTPEYVEGAVMQDSASLESLDGRLCARCHECLSQSKNQSGEKTASTFPSDLKPFVWEPVTKQKKTFPRHEELYRKISSLQDDCLVEDNLPSPNATGGSIRPFITVSNTTDKSAQTSSDDLAIPISEPASPNANRRTSQDTQELAPQRIQMPAFSDVSFDSEFADQDFLSDESEEEEEEDDLEADVKEIEVKIEEVADGKLQVEIEEEGESAEIDPELLNDKMEPELTALMSDHSVSPLDKSAAMESKTLESNIPPVEQNSSLGTGQEARVNNVLGVPTNFSTAPTAHRTKDHSSDYVLSVNINIPPFPNRVEQHWNSPQYTPNIPCSWPDTPEDVASMAQQHSEIGEQHIPMGRWNGGQRPLNTVGDKMPQRFPSESTESHLTSSSGVFTSSIQTSERVSSPNRSNESQSPVDSALSDNDIDSVRNEFEEFLSKNSKLDRASPIFSDNEDKEGLNPDGVATQVDWMDVNRSWISPDLESLRDERETVRRLSNSWDRSDIAVELMEARIMHGIGETDAFLRFLDSEIPEEEWLETKNNLELQHAEEKRDILALEKNFTQAENEDNLHRNQVTLHSGRVSSSGFSPKRRKPPSEHLKFLQGLRRDLIGSNPPSFFKEKNEIEALLEEYKELHRSSESEIAQAQRELDGSRDKPAESPRSGPTMENHIGYEEGTEKELIDREIKSLHAASLAMSLSNSPGSDGESQHQFDFNGFSSDDEPTVMEDRGKYYRLRSDLSDPLVLVKTPTKQTLQDKLQEAERQVSNEQLMRRRSSLEKERQSSTNLAGELSDSECSVLIGQTFRVLLKESAIVHQLQHHSDSNKSRKKGEWKFLFTKRDTFTYEKDHQDYFYKWYSGIGVIKAPASCIFNLIHKPSNFYAVFGRYLKKVTVLKKFDDGKSLIRIIVDARKCGLDQSRSVTSVLHAKRVRNKYVIGSTSVTQPSPLQVPGTVSAKVTCFGFCLEPLFDENGIEWCRVTVIFHVDLKSHLDEDLLQVIFQKLPSTLLCNIRGQVEVGHL